MCFVLALNTPVLISFNVPWLSHPTRTGLSVEASDRALRILRSQMASLVASEAAMNSASRVERTTTD